MVILLFVFLNHDWKKQTSPFIQQYHLCNIHLHKVLTFLLNISFKPRRNLVLPVPTLL